MIEIYYVEDDKDIATIVKEYLEQKGYGLTILPSIEAVKEALSRQIPSVVLVDWNLPDGRGDALCRWIRNRWSTLPMILLTVKGDTCDIISGFQNGADDYVVKPFELAILHSRICALLRRARDVSRQYLVCAPFTMDQEKKIVFHGEEEVALSRAEYEILRLLISNKGKTVMREQLLEQMMDYSGNYVNDNTLTVAMKRLREKLHQPSCIKTIRSFGYRMEETG